MSSRDEITVVSSRMAAAEFTVAVLVAVVFALLGWIGSGYRGASAFMPVVVSGLGTVAALVWAGGLLRRIPRTEGSMTFSKASLRRLGTLALLIVAFVAAIPLLGFFTAIFVFLAASPVLMGLRPVWQPVLAAASSTVVLWFIFKVLLDTPLPADLIFGR